MLGDKTIFPILQLTVGLSLNSVSLKTEYVGNTMQY